MEQRPSYLKDKNFNSSDRAGAALDAILKNTKTPLGLRKHHPSPRVTEPTEQGEHTAQVTVEKKPQLEIIGQTLDQALQERAVLSVTSDRDKFRLLILTRDITLTSPESLAKTRVLQLSEHFAEIHCIVLSRRGEGMETQSRISNNVWVYPTQSAYWWMTVFDAGRIAEEQLRFVDGFRADIILAEDPFESGLAAYFISKKHDRPFEVHLFDDLYDPDFRYMDDHNDTRLIAARFLLPRANGIRTKSEYLRERLLKDYKKMKDRIETLPIFYDLDAWRNNKPTFNLLELYPQFRFIMLHVTNMDETSHTDQVIRGVAEVLAKYEKAGLIVVGEGPHYDKLKKQVVTLGLSNQVIFEGVPRDLSSHMKSAHVLIHLSSNPEEEYLLLQAAAVGLPIVATFHGLAGELFLDGESAYLCSADNAPCIGGKLLELIGKNELRHRFATAAHDIVFSSVEQDYAAYLESYRDSILRGAYSQNT